MAHPKLTDRTCFSAPTGFWKEFEARSLEHGYASASEYVRALFEADKAYRLRPMLDPGSMHRVLRIPPEIEGESGGSSLRKPGESSALNRAKH